MGQSGRENRVRKGRTVARQHQGSTEVSGLAFEVRAVSMGLLPQAMFGSMSIEVG